MIVSALVLTLGEPGPDRDDLLGRLAADARLELGAVVGHRLPLVAEVPDAVAGETLVDELGKLPSVRFVDVVLVDFSLAAPGVAAS
jgi:hypothetical protein